MCCHYTHSASLFWILLSWSSGSSPRGPRLSPQGLLACDMTHDVSEVHSATPPPQQGHRQTMVFTATAMPALCSPPTFLRGSRGGQHKGPFGCGSCPSGNDVVPVSAWKEEIETGVKEEINHTPEHGSWTSAGPGSSHSLAAVCRHWFAKVPACPYTGGQASS